MRALIVANGEPPSPTLWSEVRAEVGLVVAADGGADLALARGIVPDAVVGDLDSVSADARRRIPGGHFHRDSDPHRTDLQKAITFAIGRGATDVAVIAWGGSRADHALANLSVLTLFRGEASIRLVDDRFEVTLVDGRTEIQAPPGTVVSLVAIGRCEGVRTTGLRWNLHSERLEFSPRGIHNEMATVQATVSVDSGDLLLFRGRWVEKHG
jgi:thiamine pyrophosphokinase